MQRMYEIGQEEINARKKQENDQEEINAKSTRDQLRRN